MLNDYMSYKKLFGKRLLLNSFLSCSDKKVPLQTYRKVVKWGVVQVRERTSI